MNVGYSYAIARIFRQFVVYRSGFSLDNVDVYMGMEKFWNVFRLHIAETNSLLDITNILGDNPAESHAPDSSLIEETQFLYLTLR